MSDIADPRVPLFIEALSLLDYRLSRGMEPDFHDPATAIYHRLKDYRCQDDLSIHRNLKRFTASKEAFLDRVKRIADHIFDRENGKSMLKPDLVYRSVARILDVDALNCLTTRWHGNDYDRKVLPTFSDQIYHQLEDIATHDTHIHLGGALPSLFFWVQLMGGDVILAGLREAIGDQNIERVERWREAINSAACLRLQLAAAVNADSLRSHGKPLFPWIKSEQLQKVGKTDLGWLSQAEPGLKMKTLPLREINRVLVCPEIYRYDPHQCMDPLRAPVDCSNGISHFAEGERRLLCYLGTFLSQTYPDAKLAAQQQEMEVMLGKYLSIRFSFHRLIVHDEGSGGLFRFLQTFGQRSGFKKKSRRMKRRRKRQRRLTCQLERDRMIAALEAHHHHDTQGKTEFRVTLDPGVRGLFALRGWIEGIVWQMKRHRRQTCDVGLVVHALKVGRQADADAEATATAKRLCGLLADRPGLRPLIVGFDAAGTERGYPPRLYQPAYNLLQSFQSEFRHGRGTPKVHLGYTFHVGEDYDDLLGALRQIDETVYLLHHPQAGGRLGHALALFSDPERYYRDISPYSETSRGAHLLDLIWAIHRGKNLGSVRDDALARIYALVSDPNLSDGRLHQVWRSMTVGPKAGSRAILNEARLLRQLGVDPAMLEEYINPGHEELMARLASGLQETLLADYPNRNLTIEANPTSNLLVGNFHAYAHIPYQRITDRQRPIALTLNTDDPGMFMTTLPGEFAAMYRVIAKRDCHEAAISWLKQRQAQAMRSCFLPRFAPRIEDKSWHQSVASLATDLFLQKPAHWVLPSDS